MEHIDTHDIELAFDDLMGELSKIKELNSLVDSYKDNVDELSACVEKLSTHLDVFYRKAKEYNEQVDSMYHKYADETSSFAEKLTSQLDVFYSKVKEHDEQANNLYQKYVSETFELKEMARSSRNINVVTLILAIIACIGLGYMIIFV